SFFASTVLTGPMLAALPVAAVAGFISFASPCVLPLLPGYVGYLSGMAGVTTPGSRLAGAADQGPRRAAPGRGAAVRRRLHRRVRPARRHLRLARDPARPLARPHHPHPRWARRAHGPGLHGLRPTHATRPAPAPDPPAGPVGRAAARCRLRTGLGPLHGSHPGRSPQPRVQRGRPRPRRGPRLRLQPRAGHPVHRRGDAAVPLDPGTGLPAPPPPRVPTPRRWAARPARTGDGPRAVDLGVGLPAGPRRQLPDPRLTPWRASVERSRP